MILSQSNIFNSTHRFLLPDKPNTGNKVGEQKQNFMFKKLAPFVTTLKIDFAGAIDATSKKQVLADAQTIADSLLLGHPGATAIVNFIFAELESTIK